MTALPVWFVIMSFALFGLLFGSFANVVIWRVPRGESVVSPGSHCPACEHAVRWYDNIPIFSWLVLRGRCRDCGAPIGVRYLLVEAASGVLFVVAAVRFGSTVQSLVCAFCFWLLLVLAVIDLDHMRLPNPLVAILAAAGLAAAVVSQITEVVLVPLVPLPVSGAFSSPLAYGIVGVLLGAGVPALAAALYGMVRGKRGLGMGDVKLLGALGFYLGPYVLLVLFLGSLIGMVAGLLAARGAKASDTKIPFGPWLAAGAILTTLVGPALWGWYAHLVGLA